MVGVAGSSPPSVSVSAASPKSSLELGLIGTPLAALTAGGGYQGAAHLLEQQREKTRESLDIFLDRLS